MHKEERVMNLLAGKPVDFLPSQINFSSESMNFEVARALGLPDVGALDDFLQNHFTLTPTLQDAPLYYRDDSFSDKLARLERDGFVGIDREGGVIYDSWGCGIRFNSDTFYICYHPLQGDEAKNRRAEPYLPERFDRELLHLDPGEAVRRYQFPDPRVAGNYEELEAALAASPGDTVVWPAGYVGIFERAYAILGFERYMTTSALEPGIVEELLEKITEYKVLDAREKVKRGIKYAHHGDDLGTQTGLLFSRKDFLRLLKPRLARLFAVYTGAGVPVGMHSCGNIIELVPDLIEIGIRLLEPVQPCMDLARLKKEFGRDLVFWGGIDTQDLLPFGTPERVKKETREVIRLLGEGDGYVIAPSQAIMPDVPLPNVMAFLEAVVEERQVRTGTLA